MNIFEALMKNPEQITFALLFVGLLIWVMKSNNSREERYQKTIDDLTTALRGYDDIRETVKEINSKLK